VSLSAQIDSYLESDGRSGTRSPSRGHEGGHTEAGRHVDAVVDVSYFLFLGVEIIPGYRFLLR
jgi:hypothetical protein